MVRFIKIGSKVAELKDSEQIWPIQEGATIRLVLMRADKGARKINKSYHKN